LAASDPVTPHNMRTKSDLAIRSVSALAMLAIALTALWYGGLVFNGLLGACFLLLIREWNALIRKIWPTASARLIAAVIGLIYMGAAIFALAFIREHFGFAATLWTLAIVWATDIGAYFAGRSIGGPKLAPAISPSKTWSGLTGGVIAAFGVGYLIAIQAGLPALFFWLGGPLAILAQAGDLLQSSMKRRAGVKDSGHIIPGHGGVFDRLDGAIPVAITVFLISYSYNL
jgi:phosphatidate cytidylyltransferase